MYKTVFFVTKSGQSRCNWEKGTVPRESVGMRILHGDGTARQVLPNEPAVFYVCDRVFLEFNLFLIFMYF